VRSRRKLAASTARAARSLSLRALTTSGTERVFSSGEADQGLFANVFIFVAEVFEESLADFGRVEIAKTAEAEGGPVAHLAVLVAHEFDEGGDGALIIGETAEGKCETVSDVGVGVIAERKDPRNDGAVVEVTEGGDDCAEGDGVGFGVEHCGEDRERFVGEESCLIFGGVAELGEDVGAAGPLQRLV
jgi:hypothetical protein